MQMDVKLTRRFSLALGPHGLLFLAMVGVVYYVFLALLMAMVLAIWLSVVLTAGVALGSVALCDRALLLIPAYSRRRTVRGPLRWPGRAMRLSLGQRTRRVARPTATSTATLPGVPRSTAVEVPLEPLRTYSFSLRSLAQPATVETPAVPRTAAQLDAVLREHPDNWEYLYFAGVLLAGVVGLQGKLRDQETQYVRPGTQRHPIGGVETLAGVKLVSPADRAGGLGDRHVSRCQ